jgi:beta-lactamase class A
LSKLYETSAIKRKAFLTGLLILLILNGSLLIALLHTGGRNSIESFVREFPLIDPSRNFIEQQHFITNIQPIRDQLNDYIESVSEAKIGIYFEFLNTGANIAINQEARFFPASLIKMPTALAVMKKIEEGEWKLTNELILFSEDADSRYGQLYKQKVGTSFSIEYLLKEMLINSDDTAHRILIRNLNVSEYQRTLDGLGMLELFDQDYNITAKEYSRIFRALYSSSYLRRELSQQLLEWLSATPFDNFLEAGLTRGVPFAHKIGEHDIENTYLDSGVVYIPNKPYILTVMVQVTSDAVGKPFAEGVMKDISEMVYGYVENY